MGCSLKFRFTDSLQIAEEIHNTLNKKGRREKKPFYKNPWFWIAVTAAIVLVKKIVSLESDLLELNNELCSNREEDKKLKAVREFSETEEALESEDNTREQAVLYKEEDTLPSDDKKGYLNSFRFIVNKSAKKYHTKFCSGVSRMAENKREYIEVNAESLDQARQSMEDKGYSLCGVCKRG